GATIELFSQNEGQASLDVPAGAGSPGWTAVATGTPRYEFRHPPAPTGISGVRVAVLRQGKLLRLVAKDAGLPLAVPHGAIGIRITAGALRNCARFAGSAVRKDAPGAFVGSHASSGPLADCSDGVLSGVPPPC